jgi:hypothetical protein
MRGRPTTGAERPDQTKVPPYLRPPVPTPVVFDPTLRRAGDIVRDG